MLFRIFLFFYYFSSFFFISKRTPQTIFGGFGAISRHSLVLKRMITHSIAATVEMSYPFKQIRNRRQTAGNPMRVECRTWFFFSFSHFVSVVWFRSLFSLTYFPLYSYALCVRNFDALICWVWYWCLKL